MGQREVFKLLEKNGEMTEKEIAEKLGTTLCSVWTSLKRMVKFGEVEKIKSCLENTNIRCYIFRIKKVNSHSKK